MEQLQELSRQLGYPSASKLWTEAQRRQIAVTRKAVYDFVKGQSARQVFKSRDDYKGKVVAVEINDRWAADLIDHRLQRPPLAGPQGRGPVPIHPHRAGHLLPQDLRARPESQDPGGL